MITKDNIITYAYKGLASLILTIIGKKDKIKDLFFEEDIFKDVKRNTTRLEEASNAMALMEKFPYQYKYKKKNGKFAYGTFDAYNIEQAKTFLTNEGYEIAEIKEVKKNIFTNSLILTSPIKTGEMAFALTQVSTYLKAGISLIESYRILAKQSVKPLVRKIYDMVVFDLLAGDSLSEAMSHQPKIFPKLLVNMVKSAELTGDLPSILDDMANYYEAIDKTKKELKSAMTYPMIVFFMAIAVIVFVLNYIVPKYVDMFTNWSTSLPKITVMTMAFSDFVRNNLIEMLIILIMILLVYIILYKNVTQFRGMMQFIYLKIPVVKSIIMYSEVSMFSKTFASLLNHGVFITDSMDVLIKVSDNEIYKRIIVKTVKNLNRGGKISEAFKDNPYIPIVAYEMIVTGESTGKLGTMMERVANYYENLYQNATKQVKSLVEPAMIVMLTFVVGLIIISIILPMFDLYQTIA